MEASFVFSPYRLITTAVALLFILCAISIQTGFNAEQNDRRQALARHVLGQAQQINHNLHLRPATERTEQDYLGVIKSYKQVLEADAAHQCGDAALLALAQLAQEMAQQLQKTRYYYNALDYYQQLQTNYPQSAHVKVALLQRAKIFAENLDDPAQATAIYAEILRTFPSTPTALAANRALHNTTNSVTINPATMAALPKVSSATPTATADTADPAVATITNIRNFTGPDYARIVVDLTTTADYEILDNTSDSLTLLLPAHKLAPHLTTTTLLSKPEGVLQQIRTTTDENSVRLHLQCTKLQDHAIFTLANPPRLIIDLQGPPPAVPPPVAPNNATIASTNSLTNNSSNNPSLPNGAAPNNSLTNNSLATNSLVNNNLATNSLVSSDLASNSLANNALAKHSAGNNLLTSSLPSPSKSVSLLRALGLKVRRVVIDAGHGGHDTGALGLHGIVEKELVLDISLRLRALLNQQLPQIEVVMTRDKDHFVPLEERTAIANAQMADLFISIHANSSEKTEVAGVETYYLSLEANNAELAIAARENASTTKNASDLQTLLQRIVLDDKVLESRNFANQIQRNLVTGLGRVTPTTGFNRGVKKAPFIVLVGANMPSILAEVAFVSNPQQAALLKTTDFRQHIATTLLTGIKEYLANLQRTTANNRP
jgi:N-acetylmuramoyl-L-alanine amidase